MLLHDDDNDDDVNDNNDDVDDDVILENITQRDDKIIEPCSCSCCASCCLCDTCIPSGAVEGDYVSAVHSMSKPSNARRAMPARPARSSSAASSAESGPPDTRRVLFSQTEGEISEFIIDDGNRLDPRSRRFVIPEHRLPLGSRVAGPDKDNQRCHANTFSGRHELLLSLCCQDR